MSTAHFKKLDNDSHAQWHCVHNSDAMMSIQRRWTEFWKRGDTRFVCTSNSIETVVKVTLFPKTSYGRYTAACWAATKSDVPDWLAAQRTELACVSTKQIGLDHTRTQILWHRARILLPASAHGGNTARRGLGATRYTHKTACIALHRLRTTDWRDVEPVRISVHRQRTHDRSAAA